ncbi:MAG: tetratricopeptide repeat protein [Bacteroidota bacterium]
MRTELLPGLLLATLLVFSTATELMAQSQHRILRQADRAYIDQDFVAAEQLYRQALEEDNSPEGNHNLGNSLYQQGDYEEAAKRYEEAAALTEDAPTKASAYHNLGNARFEQKDYAAAVEAYQESLRNNPDDVATKTNLSLALKRMEEQAGEGSGEGNQGSQQGQQEEGEGGESQSPEQQNGNQPSQAQPYEGRLSESEAEQLLRRVGDAETQTRQRLTGEEMEGCQSGRKW